MGRLAFPLDAELTGPDRLVLGVLQKQYETYPVPSESSNSSDTEESDDPATKHSEFVSPSPEGNLKIQKELPELQVKYHWWYSCSQFQIYKTKSSKQ